MYILPLRSLNIKKRVCECLDYLCLGQIKRLNLYSCKDHEHHLLTEMGFENPFRKD